MRFGKPHMHLNDNYNVWDGLSTHLSRQVHAYGKQPVQMHMDFAFRNMVSKHVLVRQLCE